MITISMLLIILAYLGGSMSSAIIIARLLQLKNPREEGSGNPGATNIYRLGGKVPAIAVLIFDIVKGAAPVYLSIYIDLPNASTGAVAIAACLGHVFPLYFGFKGGKGVATALGCLIAVDTQSALICVVVWMVIFTLTRYSSLASIASLVVAPILLWFSSPIITFSIGLISVLVITKHYANIKRLLTGNETSL